MADCTASGTAIDRVIHSAVSSALQSADGNGNGASRQAVQALGSFLGGTAATANVAHSGASVRMQRGVSATMMAGQNIMPMTPLEALNQPYSQSMSMTGVAPSMNGRLDEAWSSASSQHVHHPNHHPSQHMIHHRHPHSMHQAQLQMPMQSNMSMHPQQQMMMHMQMQQHQMAVMVEYQRQQQHAQAQMKQKQQQKQQSATTTSNVHSQSATSQVTVEEDDVATVNEETEEQYNEGITDDASIERLAAAWRDAEAEFAAEFGEEELLGTGDEEAYDVSNMGGIYDEFQSMDSTTGEATANAADPHYDFSAASQMYGCIQTPQTDLAPNPLSYPENLYEQGLTHFNEGNIPEAILCFESTLRNVDMENADAWRMLGKCHTENDADSKAIVCWLKSLERDPYSPETLLALGVAYVNELDWEKAVESLRGWVGNHPLYAGMENASGEVDIEDDLYGAGDVDDEVEGGARRMRPQTMAEMRDVERLLLRALEYDRTDDAAADVYEALGVVYNVSRDYDAAVDSFRRAIGVRPDDYQLRNKLGATLANSNRSEEALPSYRKALSLKPKYARGWLNMAISHSNLHNYSEAARCYLQTLSLNPEAKHVWSYLRIALTCDERWDLLPLAASQNLSQFHEFFDFVDY